MDESRAERLRDLAENLFKDGDSRGALKAALKAQRLFPSLPGITRMIAALDVHLASAANNWYAVLDIHPPADLSTINKQIKKMLLLTHPDKNRSAAAVGAFRLVMEAACILRDRKTHPLFTGIPDIPTFLSFDRDGNKIHGYGISHPSVKHETIFLDQSGRGRKRKRWDVCRVCFITGATGVTFSEEDKKVYGCTCTDRGVSSRGAQDQC